MKIFKSLNCIVCEAPFVPIEDQPRSPRHLECGKAVCHECFEKEKLLQKEQRKHQCHQSNCFRNPNFAYYLILVLSLNEKSLTLSPWQPGYLLFKPFQLPKCPICDEEYSMTIEGKSSFLLYCNDMICTGCYQKTRTLENENEDQREYHVECPVCGDGTLINCDEQKDQLHDLLAELPEMTRQLEEMDKTKYRFCKECDKLDTVDEMFHCIKCIMKICGTCAFKNHQGHKAITLLEMEACEMSDELQQFSNNEVKTYQDLFPQLHKELVDGIGIFRTRLLSEEKNLKKAPNFEVLQNKQLECIKLTTDLETICEKYMPHLRECESQVKDLIKALDKNPK